MPERREVGDPSEVDYARTHIKGNAQRNRNKKKKDELVRCDVMEFQTKGKDDDDDGDKPEIVVATTLLACASAGGVVLAIAAKSWVPIFVVAVGWVVWGVMLLILRSQGSPRPSSPQSSSPTNPPSSSAPLKQSTPYPIYMQGAPTPFYPDTTPNPPTTTGLGTSQPLPLPLPLPLPIQSMAPKTYIPPEYRFDVQANTGYDPQTEWRTLYEQTHFDSPYSTALENRTPAPFPQDFRIPEAEHALGANAKRMITNSADRIYDPDTNAQMRDYMYMRAQHDKERDYLAARMAMARDFLATNTGRRDPYTKVVNRPSPVERGSF